VLTTVRQAERRHDAAAAFAARAGAAAETVVQVSGDALPDEYADVRPCLNPAVFADVVAAFEHAAGHSAGCPGIVSSLVMLQHAPPERDHPESPARLATALQVCVQPNGPDPQSTADTS
jgi:hypothetical protein